jgi:hypothetical protein
MGLRFSFLIYSRNGTVDLNQPAADDEAAAVVRRLFPRTPYRRVDAQPLLSVCFPDQDSIAVGVFSDGMLIATFDAHLDDPDTLDERYLTLTEWPDVQLLTSRSVNDMCGYGHWKSGSLVRCFSVNSDAGVWCDDGSPEEFEGHAPVTPERWLDLANSALASSLRLEGDVAPPVRNATQWEDVALHVFQRADR